MILRVAARGCEICPKLARRDDLTEEVEDGLNLIILLARHKYDARTGKEK